MSLKLRELGADIILYPSAFTLKTGEAHWGKSYIHISLHNINFDYRGVE
jgi:predicted amidohydrolase